MDKEWTDCYSEALVHTPPEKLAKVKVAVTVSIPTDLDVNSSEAEQIIRDAIADSRTMLRTMLLAR